MAGTKEFKEMVNFGLALAKAMSEATADGDFDFSDVFKVLPALMLANDAIVGMSEIPKELADLNDAEYAELVAHFKAEFDLENDDVEAKVELGYQIALKIAQLVASFRAGTPAAS